MSDITNVEGREVLDSRGYPTVEVTLHTESDHSGRAIVPSGASTGAREAVELRDGESDRYNGQGVLEAVSNVNNEILPALEGIDVRQQSRIDSVMLELDGTDNKGQLGANAILGVSLAAAKAASTVTGQSLYRYLGGPQARTMPLPFMNVINGGAHANNNLDVQEFMIVPGGANSFSESLRWAVEIFHELHELLDKRGMTTTVGDEGGFAPDLESNRQALKILLEAIDEAGYSTPDQVALALDVASSELCEGNIYHFDGRGEQLTSGELVDYLSELTDEFPIISIEDGCDEDDWEGWESLTDELGDSVQIVGDDLFVTNDEILQEGIDQGVANSILIKVNQVGTLTETLDTVELARRSGYTSMISHRSGETEDTSIADLAVALNTGQIKTGSLSRGERTAKYNRLIRIEDELESQAQFEGFSRLVSH